MRAPALVMGLLYWPVVVLFLWPNLGISGRDIRSDGCFAGSR